MTTMAGSADATRPRAQEASAHHANRSNRLSSVSTTSASSFSSSVSSTCPPPLLPALSLSRTLCLWQLLDSSFPVGSFAHSSGLEAAVAFGVVRGRPSLVAFVRLALRHAAVSQLPTVRHAMLLTQLSGGGADGALDPPTLALLDAWYDCTVTSSVQRLASRSLGASFLATIGAAQPAASAVQSLLPLADAHFPVAFGAALSALSLPPSVALLAHLYLALRALLSAAVRLDLVGPREAAALQARLSESDVAELAEQCSAASLHDTHGLHDIDALCQAHGRLFTRLFVT